MTMPQTNCVNGLPTVFQKGVSLVEAMVAVLVLAILFAGLSYVLSRGLVSQRFAATHALAVLEMRNGLQIDGQGLNAICEDSATPGQLQLAGQVAVAATCSDVVTVSVAVASFERDVTRRTLSLSTQSGAASEGLYGGDGVILISNQ